MVFSASVGAVGVDPRGCTKWRSRLNRGTHADTDEATGFYCGSLGRLMSRLDPKAFSRDFSSSTDDSKSNKRLLR